jgi:hypothetical protein
MRPDDTGESILGVVVAALNNLVLRG